MGSAPGDLSDARLALARAAASYPSDVPYYLRAIEREIAPDPMREIARRVASAAGRPGAPREELLWKQGAFDVVGERTVWMAVEFRAGLIRLREEGLEALRTRAAAIHAGPFDALNESAGAIRSGYLALPMLAIGPGGILAALGLLVLGVGLVGSRPGVDLAIGGGLLVLGLLAVAVGVRLRQTRRPSYPSLAPLAPVEAKVSSGADPKSLISPDGDFLPLA